MFLEYLEPSPNLARDIMMALKEKWKTFWKLKGIGRKTWGRDGRRNNPFGDSSSLQRSMEDMKIKMSMRLDNKGNKKKSLIMIGKAVACHQLYNEMTK